jgi:hypothetical protein
MLRQLCLLLGLIAMLIVPVFAQDNVVVPDVRRMPLPQAASILNIVGLNLGEDTTADAVEGQNPNTIVSQSVEPGSSVARGSVIDVGVMRSPNVRLVYDDNDITFVNLTQAPMNVNGITFSSSDGTPASYNANQITGGLGGAECLQLWSINRGAAKDVAGCSATQWRTTNNTALHFWTQLNGVNRFVVTENGVQRAECPAAGAGTQDSPLTCEFFIAGGSTGADDVTPYIYLAYTTDAIAFINNTLNKWMVTDQTTLLNNNPALSAPGAPLIFGDVNLLREEFRVGLGSITQLAPGQCIMYTLEGATVTAPPEHCNVVAQRALAPNIAFWVAPFGVRSVTDGRERTCPAALPNRMTLCIVPR